MFYMAGLVLEFIKIANINNKLVMIPCFFVGCDVVRGKRSDCMSVGRL